MPLLTVRNISDELHRALRLQATQRGHNLEAELRAGLALLPAGKRRAIVSEGLDTQLRRCWRGRLLAFDLGCTQAYASLMARSRAAGLAIASADACKAAVAANHGMALATRDEGAFQAAGLAAINPWVG